MMRKSYGSILALALLGLSIGLWTGCSNSNSSPPTNVVTIAATSGSGQSATVSTAFAAPLVATVSTNGTPSSGVTVTFTAPSSGASGTFANATATETDTTNASGVATSSTFTANGTSGGYTVTATATAATTAASFSLTNNAGAATTITATAGTPQSATSSTAFATNLAATVVDAGSNPVSGVVVTFTAPGSGASGVFSDSTTNTTTATTNASGVATAATFTANTTVGGPYTVTATAGALGPANFSLTNTAPVASANYVFSLSGQEAINNVGGVVNYYAVTGAVTIDANGNVLGGEQDYNDAFGITSPQPSGDTISAAASALVVDPTTGQGTLTLTTNNATLGVGGVEIFGVQFVNASHALIMQFDGSATSSGSLDLQTTTTLNNGGYAFSISGVDPGYSAFAIGGVFSLSGTSVSNGIFDINDSGTISTANAFSSNVTTPDAFGRGSLIFPVGTGVSLNYYVVGPEVMRIINVDGTDSAVGSAFGQGAGAFNNASVGSSVLAVASDPYSPQYGALGQITTSNTSVDPASFAGVGDANEIDNGVLSGLASPISGTYSIASNGYGSLTVSNAGLGDVNVLGVYMTDPALNLMDPNNPSGGGGALVLDLDVALPSGTGVLVPQTDNTVASFLGNYAAGWQDFNYYTACGDCEFDMVSQGTMTPAGVFSLTGLDSDPFGTWTGTPALTAGDAFLGNPCACVATGRYGMLSTDAFPNPLSATINGAQGNLDVTMYQASGGQLFWLNYDNTQFGVFFGPVEQQGSLTGMPLARRGAAKTKKKK